MCPWLQVGCWIDGDEFRQVRDDKRDALVEVINAVDPTSGVHGEGNAIQALAAHHTSEAGRMVRLAGGA